MVCKVVLTFLAIGALLVNGAAIPIPVHAGSIGGSWNRISPTSGRSGGSSTLNPSQGENPDDRPPTPPPKDYPLAPTPPPKDYSLAPTPPPKDYSLAPVPPPKDYPPALVLPQKVDAPAQGAPAKNSTNPKPGGLRSKLLSSVGSMVQTVIPAMGASVFSGYATHRILGPGNSTDTGSGNSSTSSPKARRELALDPAPLYVVVRTIIDNHSRASSDGPVRPKRESESESKDSDHIASLPVFKREPVSVDEVLDPLSSLKRVPEPEPLRYSRLGVHPHGQAPVIASRPRFKREPQTWGEQGNYVGNYYANKYGSPDDVPGIARY